MEELLPITTQDLSVRDILKQKCLEKIEDELIVYSEVSENPEVGVTHFAENILEIIMAELYNKGNRINIINIDAN